MSTEAPKEQPNPVQTTEYVVGPEHRDPNPKYDHVNYLRVPKIFEIGQDDYMESRGIGFDTIEQQTGLRSFVRSLIGMNVDYRGQLRVGDRVTIKTYIENGIGNSSFTFGQTMQRDGEHVFGLSLTVVMVDDEGKKTPIPDDIRDKLLQPTIGNSDAPTANS